MKKNDTYEMAYKDLIAFFNEESKKGKARDNQFARWRREYLIEKIEGKNRYIVRKLTDGERQKQKIYSTNFLPMLREMLYNYVMSLNYSEDKTYVSMKDILLALSMVNNKFYYTTFDLKSWSEMCGIKVNDIETCKDVWYSILSRAIRTVLFEMVDKEIINMTDYYKVVREKGSHVEEIEYVLKTDESDITRLRNVYAKEYGTIYSELQNTKRIEVDRKVNSDLDCDSITTVMHIVPDIDTVQFCLDNPEKYLISKNDGKKMNQIVQDKLIRSEQGGTRYITSITKSEICDKIIKK